MNAWSITPANAGLVGWVAIAGIVLVLIGWGWRKWHG